MVYNCIKYIHSWLCPPRCTLCGNQSELGIDLCSPCLQDLSASMSSCRQCGLPLPTSQNGKTCAHCISHPPPFQHTLAAFSYQPPLTRLITELKFNNRIHLARMLGEVWIHQFPRPSEKLPEAVLPVPLHRARYRERGYNQALEIARPVAQHLDLPIMSTQLIRKHHTRPQTELSASERRRNLKGCFHVKSDFSYRHVAIFDDVVTTGSTVTELANTLVKAGVEEIDIWCVARATGKSK